jgi:radical SAM-linked protein
MAVTRFRVTFTKGQPVRYISHLDLMRTWERTFRRAGLEVAHTEGFNPRPRLVFASALALGVTSDGELMDVFLNGDVDAASVRAALAAAAAPGIDVVELEAVPLEEPPLMSRPFVAEYRVTLQTEVSREAAQARIDSVLAQATIPYERTRKGKTTTADLRPALESIWVHAWDGAKQVGLRLPVDQSGANVKPDEVIATVDSSWRVSLVHRQALRFAQQATRAA